jgi:hypothetical protein
VSLVVVVPLAVAALGAVIFLASETKLSRIGEAMLWTGLLVVLLVLAFGGRLAQ